MCKIAVNELKKLEIKNEFHIIRTGGIEDFDDIQDSLECGISMNQWVTGFYFSFLKEGNKVYKNMLENKKLRSYL